jgi:hypothetical protein
MHELKEPDKEKQLYYCRWFTLFISRGIDILALSMKRKKIHRETLQVVD